MDKETDIIDLTTEDDSDDQKAKPGPDVIDLTTEHDSNDQEVMSGPLKRRRSRVKVEDLTKGKPENVPALIEVPADDLLIEDFDNHLPPTVHLFHGPNNSKVYLLGTTHFSLESQKDVSTLIRNVRPHIVMVELCQGRAGILQMDEETLEREAKNLTFAKVRSYIRDHGMMYGVVYTLLVNMSAKLTAQLGMAPGGEFRRALAEARNFPGTMIHFGDRPIQITLKRALYVLTFWKRIKLFFHLITSDVEISPEEVERCKQKDVLDQLLDEMSEKFPELERVFIHERDIFMTNSLQLASVTRFTNGENNALEDTRVVGIVGIGHVPGICKLWGTVAEEQIPDIMAIPPPSKPSRLVICMIKFSILGCVIWGCYKVFPTPTKMPSYKFF